MEPEIQTRTVLQWNRLLFTDESYFRLTSDFRRIHIGGERETRNQPSNIIELFGGGCVFVWGSIMFGSHTDLRILQEGSITAVCCCTKVLLSRVRHFRGAVGPGPHSFS